jgi:hypothetical protein
MSILPNQIWGSDIYRPHAHRTMRVNASTHRTMRVNADTNRTMRDLAPMTFDFPVYFSRVTKFPWRLVFILRLNRSEDRKQVDG